MNLNDGHVEKQNLDRALYPVNGSAKVASNIDKFDEGKEPNLLDTPWKNANKNKLKGEHGEVVDKSSHSNMKYGAATS
jgi:hypothetical protein